MKINEQQFRAMLEMKLGYSWDRALTVFRSYGPTYAYHVTNVLLHSSERGMTLEVLAALEEHLAITPSLQHPDVSGASSEDASSTEALFAQRICCEILGLPKVSGAWPEEAQKFLDELYEEHGAMTTEQKISVIEGIYGKANISSATGRINREQVLRVYEHEVLERHELIEVILL
ncbi:MAG: hypothetical protein AAB365_02600 [Patescibacteria group bacterium]